MGQHDYKDKGVTNHQGTTNQNHREKPLHTHQEAVIGKDVEKLESLLLAGGNEHWAVASEIIHF